MAGRGLEEGSGAIYRLGRSVPGQKYLASEARFFAGIEEGGDGWALCVSEQREDGEVHLVLGNVSGWSAGR